MIDMHYMLVISLLAIRMMMTFTAKICVLTMLLSSHSGHCDDGFDDHCGGNDGLDHNYHCNHCNDSNHDCAHCDGSDDFLKNKVYCLQICWSDLCICSYLSLPCNLQQY